MKSWSHVALALMLQMVAIASPFAILANVSVTLAQSIPSIVPAADGTGSQIIPHSNRLDVTGGQLSSDRTNLFHSFTRFGLTEAQIANFISNAEIRNIFARISGGEPSIIRGTLQVSGGNANLFLMNPAGIVFGQTARLNVPADFTAITANGIRFGDCWWNAVGHNDYANLNGLPNQFAFTMAQPGAIVNAGTLAVPTGQSLALLGGTVVNTGQLSAPSGLVVVTAVAGSRFIELKQPGSLLSFTVQAVAPDASQPQPIAIPIASLPQLLTGGTLTNATGLTINANGQVELTGSGQQLPSATGSTSIAGSINTDGQTGGRIQVLGDRVGLYGANLSATGIANGGTVLVGGDYQGKGAVPNATRTYVSSDSKINVDSVLQGDGGRAIVWADETTAFYGSISGRGGINGGNGGFTEVSGKQNLVFTGKVDVSTVKGNPGTLLLDPQDIIIVNGLGGADDNQVGDSRILSGDSPNATFTISENTLQGLNGNIILEATRNIIIEDLADNILNLSNAQAVSFVADADRNGDGAFTMNLADSIVATGKSITIKAANITTGRINTSNTTGDAGSIILEAQGAISVQDIASISNVGIGNGGNITLLAGDAIKVTANIATFSENGAGGNVNLTANGDIKIGSSGGGEGSGTRVSIESFASNTNGGQSGDITLISRQGSIDTREGNLNASPGKPGNITLIAKKDIKTTDLRTEGEFPNSGNAGKITVISEEGSIDTSFTSSGNSGRIGTSTQRGTGGEITLQAPLGNITTGAIDSQGTSSGGAVTLSSGGDITIKNPVEIGSMSGSFGGGALTLNAPGIIKLPGTISTNGANIVSDISLSSLFSSELSSLIDTGGGSLILSFASNFTLPSNISIFTSGGAIKFTSAGDLSVSGDLNSFSGTGNGGDITLVSQTGSVASGNLNAFGVSRGGNVTIKALTQIAVGQINSSATVGNGGNVTLDPLGDIQVGFINSQGGTSGVGGNVDITTQQFFRATSIFRDRTEIDASIGAGGGAGGGNIIIRHGGGDRNTPFIVGNASINGTAGAITTTNNAILPVRSFPGIYWQFGPSGDIGIITSEPRPPQEIPVKPLKEESPLEDSLIFTLEERFTREYEEYFEQSPNCNIKGLPEIQATLTDIANKTNLKPGAIYVFFQTLALQDRVVGAQRKDCDRTPLHQSPEPTDVLGLLLVPTEGKPILQWVSSATRAKVMSAAQQFQNSVTDPNYRRTEYYQPIAQQFYQWLIAPLKPEIQARKIQNLVFLMDSGLRTLPLAALYDGQQHLVETYSIGLMPSFTHANTEYRKSQKFKVLAGGISKFSTSDLLPLPAVKIELETIQRQCPTQILEDEQVTRFNLRQARLNYPYEMIHLATHAKFVLGPPDQSLIVLKDEQQKEQNLTLKEIPKMGWDNPRTELLVLSACQTALGREAELGFAGIAYQSGVRSVLASVWKVDDAEVPPLMAEFYYWLSRVPTKAEALRRAQVGLLKKTVFVQYQRLKWSGGELTLPQDIQVSSDLWHPFYWAGFTIVGSPW